MALFVYFYPLGNSFWSRILTCLFPILNVKYWLQKDHFIEFLNFTNKGKRYRHIETCLRTLSLLKSTCNLTGFCKTPDSLSADVQNKANYKSDKNYSLSHVLHFTPFHPNVTCGHVCPIIHIPCFASMVSCSPATLLSSLSNSSFSACLAV